MATELLARADPARRFGGLARLYGHSGARALSRAHAVVVGLGGVGSWAAEALARSGVARLTLIDLDHIAESNINRQVHALELTLGQAKVQAMRERIGQIHPDCQVRCVEDFVSENNWPHIADLHLDSDQPLAKWQLGPCDQKRSLSAWGRLGASGTPIGLMWRTSRRSPTTRCWPSCVTACASTRERRARA